jgi:hypothetical protein
MANSHGGKREGAGRKPGSPTKRRREIIDEAAKDGITPLEYMLAVLRDEKADTDRRDRMAAAAAPYIHPRLSNVEASVAITGHEAALAELEDAATLIPATLPH